MIKINLLPQEVPGKSAAAAPARTGGGGAIVALLLIFAFAVVAIAGGFVYNVKRSAEAETERLKAQENARKNERAELQRQHADVQEALQTLRNQVAVLEILDPEDRLFWAKKLNILPMFVPDGVFLTSIGMEENVKEVETPESRRAYDAWRKRKDKNAPQPPRVYVPVITSGLRLNAVAYVADGTSDQRLELILDFYRRLETQTATVPFSGEEVGFLENMIRAINSEEYSTDSVEGREVTKFSFFMNSIPVTMNTKKNAKAQ